MASKRNLSQLGDEESGPYPKISKQLTPSATSEPHQASVKSLPYPSPNPSSPLPSIPFQQPRSLLTFSYTPSHELEFTDSAKRYFVEPPRGAELDYGYDRWIRRAEDRGRIDSLLRAWDRERKLSGSSSDVGVISWRGVITKILIAPYEKRDSWELNVMNLGGTMYFEEHASAALLKQMNNMAPRQRLQMYFGYSFESYCTSSTPTRQEAPNAKVKGWGGDVDTNIQWCNVVKTKLGDTRIVIGGEVDCVRAKSNSLVELKTSLIIRGAADEVRFEQKLLKFYFQSFLLGVPEIIVGFRTPSGQVTTTQSFKTLEIPRLVRGKPGTWDPSLCLNWGHQFFGFLKGVTAENGHGTADGVNVWRVKFTPQTGVSVELLDHNAVEDVEGGEDRVGFLPKWYWEEIKNTSGISDKDPATASANVSASEKHPSGWVL